MSSKLLGQTKGITVVNHVKKTEKEVADEDSLEKEEEVEASTATNALDNSSSDEKREEFSEDSDVTVVSE